VSTLVGGPFLTQASAAAASDDRNPDPRPERVGPEAWVIGTGGQGLLVREGPGVAFPSVAVLPESTLVRVTDGPRFDREGRAWYRIARADPPALNGWSVGDYLTGVTGLPLGTVVQSSRLERTGSGRSIGPVRVSAYTYQIPGNGAHGSVTRSGTVVRWGTAAVDPQVIALGSRLQVEGFDTIFIAEDTGGAVIGNRIEIFFPDEAAALQFGVRYLQVTVLDDSPPRPIPLAPSRP
jgi:3D (Asp-Asp-Asp) domain-containing protein